MPFSPEVLVILGGMLFAVAFAGLLLVGRRHPRWSESARLEMIRTVPFLANLSTEHLSWVARIVRELRVPPNVYVIREHRIGEAMYIVMSGTLHILKRGAHEDTLVQTVGPGELIGEMALMTGARRIASARAITACLLLQIDRDDFQDLLASDSEVTAAIWHACEVHSIDLSLRDYERMRALPLAERKAWIASRTSTTTETGTTLVAREPCYVAVVAGSIEIEGVIHRAPELTRLRGGEQILVGEAGRICWLPTLSEMPLAV